MELKKYKLGDILELQRGYDLPSSLMKKGNVLVAGSNGIIGTHNIARSNQPCITVGRSGSVGKVHYYEQPTWAHNTALFIKDFKGNFPKYLYYLLQNLHLDKIFANGSSVVPSLDRKVVHSLKIPFHEEVFYQRKIASVLSNIDKKIELNRRINQNLEAMAKQLYDYWFVQFDFPDENGRPYKSSGGKMVWNENLKREIPEIFEWCTLKDFIQLEDSKRIPLSSKERLDKKGIYPYYGATGIMDYVNDYIFDGDYLLLAEDGSTSDANGNPIVQYIWGKNWVNNHAHIILPQTDGFILYTYQLLKNIPAKMIETGSIQKKISQENLLAYKIILPIQRLIKYYCEIISPLWEQRKNNIEEILALTKQRDELLPLLMNGQVSVNSDL